MYCQFFERKSSSKSVESSKYVLGCMSKRVEASQLPYLLSDLSVLNHSRALVTSDSTKSTLAVRVAI